MIRDAETVRVTLWFDTSLEDVRRHLGDDFKPETGEGITVEACAAALVRNHHAKYGYIGFRVQLNETSGWGFCPGCNQERRLTAWSDGRWVCSVHLNDGEADG